MKRSSKRLAPGILATALVATGVSGVPDAVAASSDPVILAAGPAAAQTLAANAAHHDSAADHSWNSTDVATVTLTGSGATTTSSKVMVSGAVVTVTGAGTYQFTGSLTNGRIVVNTTETGIVRLILNGATVTNSTTAPLQIVAATEVMVVVNAGTTNQLTDALANPVGAALFSQANLTITGTGSLTVRGNAADAIASEGGLVIDSASITANAVDEGVRGENYLYVNSGTLNVTTTSGDGLKSDNETTATMGYVALLGGTTTVTAGGDGVSGATDVVTAGGVLRVTATGKGVKAGVRNVISDGQVTVTATDDGVHSDAAVVIDGGTTTISTGDDGVHAETTLDIAAGGVTVTRSLEGLEALKLTVSGGTVTTTASDDSLNASEEGLDEFAVSPNAFIRVTGGTVVADGGTDGLDSNGTIQLVGGTVVVAGSATRGGGEGGLDSNGALTITGGTVLSTGISATTSRLPSSGQGWVSVTFSTNQAAGTIVHLATTSGAQIAAFRSTKAFRGVVFSSNQITRGQSYRVYTGGSVSGTSVGGGMYTGGTLSGTLVSTVTAGTQSGGTRP